MRNSARILPASAGILAALVLAVFAALWLTAPPLLFELNDDAPAHVTVTSRALAEHPVEEHHLLPLFTLSAPGDVGVDDLGNASLTTDSGLSFYTSFPPGAFVLAFAVESVTGAFTLTATRALGLVLFAATTVLLYFCALKVLPRQEGSPRLWAAGLALAYAASPIGLQSAFFGYWGHSIVQVALAATLLVLTRDPLPRIGAAGVAVLAFAGGYSEWTAYALFGVLAILLLFRRADRAGSLIYAAALAAGLLAALALTAVQWMGVAELSDVLRNMLGRGSTRSDASTSVVLRLALVLALALLPAVPFALPLLRPSALRAWRASARIRPPRNWFRLAVLVLLVVSLAENVVLMRHAAAYVYDTNKTVLLALLLIATFPPPRLRLQQVAAALVLLALAASVAVTQFRVVDATVAALPARVAGAAVGELAAPDDTIATDYCPVRGGEILSAGRNMIECVEPERVGELVDSRPRLLLLDTSDAQDGLVRWERYEDGALAESGDFRYSGS